MLFFILILLTVYIHSIAFHMNLYILFLPLLVPLLPQLFLRYINDAMNFNHASNFFTPPPTLRSCSLILIFLSLHSFIILFLFLGRLSLFYARCSESPPPPPPLSHPFHSFMCCVWLDMCKFFLHSMVTTSVSFEGVKGLVCT